MSAAQLAIAPPARPPGFWRRAPANRSFLIGAVLSGAAGIIGAAERRIRQDVPQAGIIYLEPDVDRGPEHDTSPTK